MIRLFTIGLLFTSHFCFTQEIVGALSKEIKEISGLVFVNDSTMAAHNDGGNDPVVFFLNLKGEIQHQVRILNAKNVDWEDIAFDGKDRLFIGDIGNNNNDRKDLCIYQISLRSALANEEVSAKVFTFKYNNQTAFPPKENDLHFDAEALAFYNDSLYIFTKCRAQPWDGNSYVYSLSTDESDQKAQFLSTLYVGKSGWWQDAITGVDIVGNQCYLLTYNRMMVYTIEQNKLRFEHRIYLKPITQKESIAVNKKGQVYVADERQTALGGGYLYTVPAYAPKTKKKTRRKK